MPEHQPKSAAVELLWRRVFDDASFEHFQLERTHSGWSLHGRVVAVELGAPLYVDYRIECSAEWLTRACVIDQEFDGARRQLSLTSSADGWRIDDLPAPSLAGCTDVDLGISPSTNTLPINRLRLVIGKGANIRAAWVKFPSLEVIAAEQGYDRLAEHRYLYRNIGSEFRAELEIDSSGLVIDYEKIWKRIAVSH